jgi:putative alpha-1,2-mannosidase
MAKLRNRFSLNGVPGNDDSGALSSWYIFSATGFFPNSGQDKYYITSPIFEQITFNLDNGNKFTIVANGISDSNKYIQSVKINGIPYYETYFTHDVIVNGGTVEYQMGPTAVNYAKADK